jgi:hypothetical protein
MKRFKKEEEDDISARHLGIISGRCLYWWRKLPARARAWYDAEDMISEVRAHVWRKQTMYDAAKARESTWIHHVADNCCLSILLHMKTMKYAACETVDLETMTPRQIGKCAEALATQSDEELAESANVVERVLMIGSDGVLDLLQLIFEGRAREASRESFDDLVKTARRCGASADDFVAVYRQMIA